MSTVVADGCFCCRLDGEKWKVYLSVQNYRQASQTSRVPNLHLQCQARVKHWQASTDTVLSTLGQLGALPMQC